jgi:hypothetical protein
MVLMLKDVDWEELKKGIMKQTSFTDKYGVEYKEIVLGKVSDLTPSGKRRYFGRPARNLEATGPYDGYQKMSQIGSRPPTKHEQEDSDWWRDLCLEARKHKIYVRPSDKDRNIIVAGMKSKD